MGESAKRNAAKAAVDLVEPGTIIGVGSGSTVGYFIEALGSCRLAGAIPSSEATRQALERYGVALATLEDVDGRLALYVDGADRIDPQLLLLKGKGRSHVREKILASCSDRFVCIADSPKVASSLAGGTIPVEVLPMALAPVRRELATIGPVGERVGVVTDNGNVILDVSLEHEPADPVKLEIFLEAIPGVLGCGLFARRPADLALIGDATRVRSLEPAGVL